MKTLEEGNWSSLLIYSDTTDIIEGERGRGSQRKLSWGYQSSYADHIWRERLCVGESGSDYKGLVLDLMVVAPL